MDDVEITMREAEAAVERSTRMMAEAEDLLKRSEELAAQGATPELARSFLEKQTAEVREQAEREIQALHEELERDLPKREVPPSVRVRPTRSMV